MGHLIHPVASRLGLSAFWNSNSVTSNNNEYFQFNLEDIFFQKLFTWFYRFLEKNNFLFTHILVSRLFQRILFCTLIYNSDVDSAWYSFYKRSYRKMSSPRKIKLSSIKSFFLHLNKENSTFYAKDKSKKENSFFFDTKKRELLFFKKYRAFKFLRLYRKFLRKPFYSVRFQSLYKFPKLLHLRSLKKNFSYVRFFRKLKTKKSKKSFLGFRRYRFSFYFRKRRAIYKKSKKLKRIKSSYSSKFFKSLSVVKNFNLKHFFNKYFVLDSKGLSLRTKFKKSINKRYNFYKNKRKNKLKKISFFKQGKFFFIKEGFFPFIQKISKATSFISYLANPSKIFLKTLTLNAYNFFKSLHFWYFFNFKNKLLGFFLNNSLLVNSKFSFLFFFLTSGAFNATLICKYITARLHQGVLLFDIIKPLITKLIAFERMSGFKISCAGRFSRRQIAAYSWQLRGELPLNSFGRVVDYSYSSAFLNNSVCGLKVWLCFPEKSLVVKRRGFFFSGRSFCL